MSLIHRGLRLTLGAGVAVRLALLGWLFLPSVSAVLTGAPPAPALGNEQSCGAYSGLPAGWGKDAHAGNGACRCRKFRLRQ